MIVVTGGTGSFGRAFIRHLDGQAVRVLSRDEEKQRLLSLEFPGVECVIGDVRDRDRVREVLKGATHVIHAAALKQVPPCEKYPSEAVKTNVLGTQNVADACADLDIPLVALSTDKAVEPANAYGATKMLAERIVLSRGGSVVRYGNVVGSRGSIVPVFRRQVAEGQPITITDERMTRFLLTLDDAVGLVDLAMSRGRAITYVAKPPGAWVMDIARAIGGVEYPVQTIGIRPGEKLHETLVSAAEHPVEHADHFEVMPDWAAIGYSYTSDRAQMLTGSELLALLNCAPTSDY